MVLIVIVCLFLKNCVVASADVKTHRHRQNCHIKMLHKHFP